MDKRYSFIFLRNPIERVLSYYYFCKSRDPKEFEIYATGAAGYPWMNFCRWVSKTHW